MKLRHVGLVVSDLVQMRRFYEGVLAFSPAVVAEESGPFIDHLLNQRDVAVTTCKLAAPEGDVLLELLEFSSPAPIPKAKQHRIYSRGISHFALTVDSADEVFGRIIAAGCEHVSTPRISADGKAKVAFCCDPEENYIEIVEELTTVHSASAV